MRMSTLSDRRTHTVVCLGDSITLGQISVSYIWPLRDRFVGYPVRFINAGVNNDLAYNLLTRLNSVIRERPDTILVLAGTNDVLSSLSVLKTLANFAVKGIPRWPNLAWYIRNMRLILGRLKASTRAALAVATLPVLGEDLDSLANQRVRQYNQALAELTEEMNIPLLPVYERMADVLQADPRPKRAYTHSIRLTAEVILRCNILGAPFDRLAEQNGFALLTDSVHLNSRGAAIVANEMEAFLRRALPPEPPLSGQPEVVLPVKIPFLPPRPPD